MVSQTTLFIDFLMIQPKFNNKNNTIFMDFDSIEINLVMNIFCPYKYLDV